MCIEGMPCPGSENPAPTGVPIGAMIVTTAKTQRAANDLLPPFRNEEIHVASTSPNIRCCCGSVHTGSEETAIRILVGDPDRFRPLVELPTELFTFAIVPEALQGKRPSCPHLVLRETTPAQIVVQHLLGGAYGAGLICYRTDDLATIIKSGSAFSFTSLSGTGAMTGDHAASLIREATGNRFLPDWHLGVFMGRSGTLWQISAIAAAVSARTFADAHAIFYACINETEDFLITMLVSEAVGGAAVSTCGGPETDAEDAGGAGK